MKKNYLIITLIVISMFSMIFTIYERFSIESDNKGVEIILDFDEVEALAKQSDKDLVWWFRKFKELGVSSVAINEESLQSLLKGNKKLQIEMVENIIKRPNLYDEYFEVILEYYNRKLIDKYDLVVITGSKEVFDFIRNGLLKRYPENFIKVSNNKNLLIIDGTEEEALYIDRAYIKDVYGRSIRTEKELISSKIDSIGLGFDKDKIELVKTSGLKVVPRPINYSRYPDKLLKAYIEDINTFDIKPSMLIFAGKEILGYDKSQEKLINFLRKNNITVGLIETGVQRKNIEQDGIEELSEKLDYKNVRIFPIWPYIQTRYKFYNYEGAEEIENAIYRAVTERNIRVVYFRPFKKNSYEYVTDYKEYERTFSSLRDRLKRHNIKIGTFTVMNSIRMNVLRLGFIGVGLVAFTIILLELLVSLNDREKNYLVILGIIGVYVIVYFMPNIADKILAFAAAVIFPSLSFALLIRKVKSIVIRKTAKESIIKIILDSIFVLLKCTFISIIGGLYVGAILSDIKYLLEIDIFRGIKLSQLLPLFIFTVYYFSEFGYSRDISMISSSRLSKEELNKFLNLNIKLKHILYVTIGLLIGYIYIARTGHETSIQPTELEMIARNFLENILLARPRTKEFLLAFPSLMLSIYVAYKSYVKIIYPIGLVSVIGLTSIVNTFSHLRTPLYLSIIRTLYSIGFGAVLGILIILIIEFIRYFFNALKGRNCNE